MARWGCALVLAGAAAMHLGSCSTPTHASPAPRAPDRQAAPIARHSAITVSPPTDESARRAAAGELGSEAAAQMPAVERAAPQPADPGAQALIDSIMRALSDRPRDDAGETVIALRRVRNQSRADREEFAAFLDRFAELLTHAAEDDQVRFVAAARGVQPDYVLSGTCYLMTASGFDQWELYLTLARAGEGRDWPLWQSKNPVRVLRQPRPGAPQIMPN